MLEVVSKLLVSKRPVSASISESSNPPGIAPKHEVLLSGVIPKNVLSNASLKGEKNCTHELISFLLFFLGVS